MAIKKLSKRDSTTKVKALAELAGFFDEAGGRDEEAIALALPQWQSCLEVAVLDPDRRVREAFFVTHKVLAMRVKRQMAKHLKPMMLPWLCGRFDVEPAVRAAANASFSAFFPPGKVADALAFCGADVVREADETLAHSAQTMCDPKLYSKEEAAETHERCTAATLLALAHCLDQLPADRSEPLLARCDALAKPALWKLAAHASVLVRTALYTLARSIALHAPGILAPRAAAGGDAQSALLKAAAGSVLGALADKDPGAHAQMWEAVLAFLKTFPQALATIDVSKAVLPRLYTFVRAGAYGSAPESFPCLAPLLHLMAAAADPASGGPCTSGAAHLGVLCALWAALPGLTQDARASEAAAAAFGECLTLAWHLKCQERGPWTADLEAEVLLPALRALLAREGPPGGGARLRVALAECLAAVASRDNLAGARPAALACLRSALSESEPLAAPAACGADTPRRLAAFMEALATHAGLDCEPLRSEACAVAAALEPACAGRSEGRARATALALLTPLVGAWGLAVLPARGAAGGGGDAEASLALLVRPAVEAALGLDGAGAGEDAWSDAVAEELALALALAVAILAAGGSAGRERLWGALVASIAGAGAGPQRLGAAAGLLRSAAGAGTDGPAGWRCMELDTAVCDAAARLLSPAVGAPPGLLQAQALKDLLLAALPEAAPGRRLGAAFLSDAAVESVMQHLTGALERAGGSVGRTDRDGADIPGDMESGAAAVAALEVCARVLQRWAALAGGAAAETCGSAERAVALLTAVMHLRGVVSDAGRRSSCQPRFDHCGFGAGAGGALRPRAAARACELWDAVGRPALVAALDREGAGARWVRARVDEVLASAAARGLGGRGEALVLADQALEIVAVAREGQGECAGDRALGALLEAGRREEPGAVPFLLRMVHGAGVVGAIAAAALSGEEGEPGRLWVVEALVAAYARAKPAPVFPESAAVASAEAAAAEEEAREADGARAEGGEAEQGRGRGSEGRGGDADAELGWALVVGPLLGGADGGAGAGAGRGPEVARRLVQGAFAAAVRGPSPWEARELLHVLCLVVRGSRGLAEYTRLCAEMINGPASEDGPDGAVRALVATRAAAPLLRSLAESVGRLGAGDVALYEDAAGGGWVAAEVGAVHTEVFPPYFSIRLPCGREKQTEGCRLVPSSLLDAFAVPPAERADVATGIEAVRAGALALLGRCGARVLVQRAGPPKDPQVLPALAALALGCRSGLSLGAEGGEGSTGGTQWLRVVEATCAWFAGAPAAARRLPSPESMYMLAATGGGAAPEDPAPAPALDSAVSEFWLAQLGVAADGGCVRALVARGAAWALAAAQLHVWLADARFRASPAHHAALRLLVLCARFVPVDAVAGGAPSAAADAREDGATAAEEDPEVVEDSDEEVVEVVDDESDDGGAAAGGGAGALDGGWPAAQRCGFAQALGELVRLGGALSPAALEGEGVAAAAAAAQAAPPDVLARPLAHLAGRRRVALCEALHPLLGAPRVHVQVAAFRLLARMYAAPEFLSALDALPWDGLAPDDDLDRAPAPPRDTSGARPRPPRCSPPAPLLSAGPVGAAEA
jgi:hypothetical protein